MKALRIKIYGRVQGVFFRSSAKEKAENLGISGWAKNEPDGTVLIVAQGDENNLKELIKWCYNGVEGAWVDKVEIESREADEKFREFKVKYD